MGFTKAWTGSPTSSKTRSDGRCHAPRASWQSQLASCVCVCACEEPSVGVWLGVGAAFLHSALYTLERNQSHMIRTTSVAFSTLPSISIALMSSFAVHGSRTGLCDGKVGRGWAVDCLHLCHLGPGLRSLGILLDSSILLLKKKKKGRLKLKGPCLPRCKVQI